MKIIFKWLARKGGYIKNPLNQYKCYRRFCGGIWGYVDWHWLRIGKRGCLEDAQGRVYSLFFTERQLKIKEDYRK